MSGSTLQPETPLSYGGGIFNINIGLLTVSGSTLQRQLRSVRNGGGIYNEFGNCDGERQHAQLRTPQQWTAAAFTATMAR